jgi:hypothetical protein
MLDDDDVSDAVIVGLSGNPGCLGIILVAVIVLVMMWIVGGNKEECAELHCSGGKTPKLMAHECLCVERAQ